MAEVCGRILDRRSDEFYDDTCEDHPTGCHVEIIAPGVEFHPNPAFKKKPTPGALEAEAFEREIDETEMKLLALRINRQLAQDEAYKAGMN